MSTTQLSTNPLARRLDSKGRIRLTGKWYMSAKGAKIEYGYSFPFLDNARNKGCIWLGRKIGWRFPLILEDGKLKRARRIHVHLIDDLEAIKDAMETGVPAHLADKPQWPSYSEVIDDGYGEDFIKRNIRAEKIRTRDGIRRAKNGRMYHAVTELNPDDLERLGNPRVPDEKWLTNAQAEEEPYCLSGTTLGHYRTWCSYLGRPLIAEKRDDEWYNLKADLIDIVRKRSIAKMDVRLDDKHIDPDGTVWLPTSIVEKTHGLLEQELTSRERRGKKSAASPQKTKTRRTGRPRVAPEVRGKQIDRVHPKIPNGKLRVWEEQDVLRRAAWKKRSEATSSNGHANGHHPINGEVAQSAARNSGDESGQRQRAKKKRGRDKNEKTQQVYKYCYEHYIENGDSGAQVVASARTFFDKSYPVPKSRQDVAAYATRWATKGRTTPLPLERKSRKSL